MTLTRVELKNFTAFEYLDLELSPGLNVLVGANGTGKTHIMKVCYAACDVSKTGVPFTDKLVRVFLPSGRDLRRLVKRRSAFRRGSVEVFRKNNRLCASFTNHSNSTRSTDIVGVREWETPPVESVYIPVKEMLSNAPGFLSLYAAREIHFEEVYADILNRAYRPPLRDPVDLPNRRLLDSLQKVIGGKVAIKNEEFFLRNRQGNLEFSLLAEGMRKLALLWLLIQNGSLQPGAVLFWDEPETNLNPKLYGVLMSILLALQRTGVQVFLATHDYVVLKELDLRIKEHDQVAFHSLYHAEDGEIACRSTGSYSGIRPSAISETLDSLYDREIERTLGGITR